MVEDIILSIDGCDDHKYHFAYSTNMEHINFNDFLKVEMHIGTILRVEEFPEARKPAYKLFIDFGEKIGAKKTSAQITDKYKPEDLLNRQIVAVTNFPPKQIGKFMSEVLVLGAQEGDGKVTLLEPNLSVPNGTRIA